MKNTDSDQSQGQTAEVQASGSKFINPYNFVRLHTQKTQGFPPVPHDRFYRTAPDNGEPCYSGTIRCRLTVDETPLFIPDSEQTDIVLLPEDIEPDLTRIGAREGSEVTFTERIVRDGDGAQREVDPASVQLLEIPDYRDEAALQTSRAHDQKYGRVKHLDGRLRIVSDRPLKSGHKRMSFFRLNGRPTIPSTSLKGMLRALAEAASNSCLSQFDGDAAEGWRPNLDHSEDRREYGTPHPGILQQLPTATQDGLIVKANYAEARIDNSSVWDGGIEQYQNGESVWFSSSSRNRRLIAEHVTKQENLALRRGWLKISGDMQNKQHHRIFFIPDENDTVSLSYRVLEDFRAISKMGKTTDLREGDLIYYHYEGGEVVSVGNAHLYKRSCTTQQDGQVHAVRHQDRLARESYAPCASLDNLCPCCAMFGLVTRQEDHEAEGLAGRVRVGTAALQGDAQFIDDQTLQVLSSPKPQYALFYLMQRDGTSTGRFRWQDNDTMLRGRKFYHHKLNLQVDQYTTSDRSNQNSTVKLLTKGRFIFTVEFYNLQRWEVGLLLWALNPGEAFRHKLGMGKPLGLGSVKIAIPNFKEIRRDERYRSILASGEHLAKREEFIVAYKKWISGCTSDDLVEIEQAWQSLPFIADLLRVLRWQALPHGVHYPRRKDQNGSPRGYQWFVDFRNDPEQTLPTPEEVAEDQRALYGWQ